MKRKSYDSMQCPIARTLERVGEWWSILILRDAMYGMTRFEQFQKNLGISPNILSARLATLVEHGFLEKRVYSEAPYRLEYILTAKGHAFEPVILSMSHFGTTQLAPEGAVSVLVDRETGKKADLAVVDKKTGKNITWPEYIFVPGPAASPDMKRVLEFAEEMAPEKLRAKKARRRA
ncbi:hypothetical protein AYM40_26760 [Paraburkholderia phytofirmans OLGA172]|uniref:HTH hxlR-type domain-containing protein n=1 Tax=Paraburkholderia phytofirmans OLGA172 TaxID=1417228 RepID=A0A160FSK6_9BURK|nr:helix-turn-helix domain-containing protein [Paraburkholderia phytofirmans]ANB75901.1 hypothetical protein AYM40_26760 [Paraburkholderia phytofirmans OLGA172]